MHFHRNGIGSSFREGPEGQEGGAYYGFVISVFARTMRYVDIDVRQLPDREDALFVVYHRRTSASSSREQHSVGDLDGVLSSRRRVASP